MFYYQKSTLLYYFTTEIENLIATVFYVFVLFGCMLVFFVLRVCLEALYIFYIFGGKFILLLRSC